MRAATLGFVGTRGFAAPELYRGTAKFTNAIDTYAFGATALLLATGSLPRELTTTPPVPSSSGYFSGVSPAVAAEIVAILDSCLAAAPGDRPPMSAVRDVLAKHLLFDRHQALVVFKGRASYLNSKSRSVNLNLPTVGQIEILYDGLVFRAMAVSGEVFINNRAVTAGEILPGSCVVSLGGPQMRTNVRKFITFDLSHPEIVL